jgi:hypothetical protein
MRYYSKERFKLNIAEYSIGKKKKKVNRKKSTETRDERLAKDRNFYKQFSPI